MRERWRERKRKDEAGGPRNKGGGRKRGGEKKVHLALLWMFLFIFSTFTLIFDLYHNRYLKV